LVLHFGNFGGSSFWHFSKLVNISAFDIVERIDGILTDINCRDGMTVLETLGFIGKVAGSTLLGSANVNFVALKASQLFVNSSENPGTMQYTSGFQKKAPAEKDVAGRVGQEEHWERSRQEAPGDGSNNSNNQSSQKSGIEESLSTIRDAENVFLSFSHVAGSNSGNDEHAGDNTELTADHESSQVVVVVLKEDFTGGVSKPVGLSLFLGELGNGEVGNLGSFQTTNDAQKAKEEDNGSTGWNGFPHGSVSAEESCQGHSESKAENSNGHETASVEENVLQCGAWWLVGFDRLSSKVGSTLLDEVANVQKSRKLNRQGNPHSDDGKPSIDCGKFNNGGIGVNADFPANKNQTETINDLL
jgi:hypothetical protein